MVIALSGSGPDNHLKKGQEIFIARSGGAVRVHFSKFPAPKNSKNSPPRARPVRTRGPRLRLTTMTNYVPKIGTRDKSLLSTEHIRCSSPRIMANVANSLHGYVSRLGHRESTGQRTFGSSAESFCGELLWNATWLLHPTPDFSTRTNFS